MTVNVLDPTFDDNPSLPAMAQPLSHLAGSTIALLDNGKLNVSLLLDYVEAALTSDYQVGTVLRLRKPDASRPAPAEVTAQLANCDAVISAVGD